MRTQDGSGVAAIRSADHELRTEIWKMGRVADKVAFITGAARGQGQAHAVRLAEEGADIVALDLVSSIRSVPYELASPSDLAETVELVKATGRRIHAAKGDVRDQASVDAVVADAIDEFGHIDIVVANAGIFSFSAGTPTWRLAEDQWQDLIDVNLTGVWHTVKAVVPRMVEAGRGGAIILTSSSAGLEGMPNMGHYVSAKHGLTGLMRSLAIELGPERIRVNTVNPTTVSTRMVLNDATYAMFRPDLDHPSLEDAVPAFTEFNAIPVPWVDPSDVASAVLWLASDEARYVTGVALPIDAGALVK